MSGARRYFPPHLPPVHLPVSGLRPAACSAERGLAISRRCSATESAFSNSARKDTNRVAASSSGAPLRRTLMSVLIAAVLNCRSTALSYTASTCAPSNKYSCSLAPYPTSNQLFEQTNTCVPPSDSSSNARA